MFSTCLLSRYGLSHVMRLLRTSIDTSEVASFLLDRHFVQLIWVNSSYCWYFLVAFSSAPPRLWQSTHYLDLCRMYLCKIESTRAKYQVLAQRCSFEATCWDSSVAPSSPRRVKFSQTRRFGLPKVQGIIRLAPFHPIIEVVASIQDSGPFFFAGFFGWSVGVVVILFFVDHVGIMETPWRLAPASYKWSYNPYKGSYNPIYHCTLLDQEYVAEVNSRVARRQPGVEAKESLKHCGDEMEMKQF